MTYLKVTWHHSHPTEPVFLYSELDESRFEQRKVEIFADGSWGYASSSESLGNTRLGEEPVPSLADIASDPQFSPEEIGKEEFEAVLANLRRE